MSIFMNEYMAYAAASAAVMRAQSVDAYMAANAVAMQNGQPSITVIGSMANAYPPSAHVRDRWMSDELGIPSVAEDIQ